MDIGSDGTFSYDSPAWTSRGNAGEYGNGNIKYQAFDDKAFTRVKGCIDQTNECVEFQLDRTYSNAVELFTSGRSNYGVVQQDFNRVFGVDRMDAGGLTQNCGPAHSGFGVDCRDNNKVRWGYSLNLRTQNCQPGGDSDGTVGFGIKGQDCCPMGAGNTNAFQSTGLDVWGSQHANFHNYRTGQLYVQ
jgi:hypothetical protein